MKKYKLTLDEDELKAVIAYHAAHHILNYDKEGVILTPSVETSARIHDLTKRLNRDTPEVEIETETEVKPEPEQQKEITKW